MIIDKELSDLDNQLCIEAFKQNPNIDLINELIIKGANINVIIYDNDSLLMQLINPEDENDKNTNHYDIIKYLIEKGVDLNYIDPSIGYNCLINAQRALKPDIFELLLKNGIYQNNICFESPMSIFDTIYCDTMIELNEKRFSKEDLDNYDKILWLIEDNGAKMYDELYTTEIEEFIIIGDFFEYGLITKGGSIKIENIINDKILIEKFNKWVIGNHYPYDLCHKVKEKNISVDQFEEHIKNGFSFCKELKEKLKINIKITLYSIDINNYKINNNWNIKAYAI